MKRIIVKMITEGEEKPVLMELPGEIPVEEIIPNLIQGEGWKVSEEGRSIQYWFETETGRIKNENTLTAARVKNNSLITIRSTIERISPKIASMPVEEISADPPTIKLTGSLIKPPKTPPQNISVGDLRGSLVTPNPNTDTSSDSEA